MDDLSKQLKDFEASIFNIYNAENLRWSELESAINRASQLIKHIKLIAQNNKNLQLQAFMDSILAAILMLQKLAANSQNIQTDPDLGNDPSAENPNMQNIMQMLSKIYNTHLEPMIGEIAEKAKNGEFDGSLDQVTMFASLGNDVLNCTNDVVKLRNEMDNKEKICAALGIIMMFAGIGLLLAVIINPATAPIMVPLVIISLGCYLSRRSVSRQKAENNPDAVNINTNLDKTAGSLDQFTTGLKQVNPARKYLFFSEGPKPDKAAEAHSSFTLVDTILDTFKRFFTPQK